MQSFLNVTLYIMPKTDKNCRQENIKIHEEKPPLFYSVKHNILYLSIIEYFLIQFFSYLPYNKYHLKSNFWIQLNDAKPNIFTSQ